VTASNWVIGYQNFTHLVSLFSVCRKLLQASKLMLQFFKKLQNYTVFLEGGSLNAYRCVNIKLMLEVSQKLQNYTVFLEGGSLNAYCCVNIKFCVAENNPIKLPLTSYKIALKLFWYLCRERTFSYTRR